MQYVYPKLSEYCRQEHGLEFQVNVMSRDQLVTSHPLLAMLVKTVGGRNMKNNQLERDKHIMSAMWTRMNV